MALFQSVGGFYKAGVFEEVFLLHEVDVSSEQSCGWVGPTLFELLSGYLKT